MKTPIHTTLVASLVALSLAAGASVAAEYGAGDSKAEVSVMGGVQALNQNDTALPETFISVPAVATLTYRLTPLLAVEGEFTWLIPVQQQVELGSGVRRDLKTPDILAYQANLRADWPQTSWTPYLAGGVGAVTFLSNTDSDRMPQLPESQTMFALNFGAGLSYPLASGWALRGDFREFAAFPSKDQAGLSTNGSADPIWMERGTLGLSYRY